MEENKTTKTTKKKVNEKKTEVKEKKVKEIVKEQPQVDMEQMFQMFQMFMSQIQKPNELQGVEVKNKSKGKSVKKNKSYLRKERKDDEVIVRSVVGTVCFKSPKSGIVYNWYDVGDEESLTIEEVLQMEIASKSFLHSPWLYVEDDEVNKILGISEANKVEDLVNIDNILEEYTIGEIEDILVKSSSEYRKTFASLVMNKIRDEELRDTILIRELGRILKIDFDLFK